MSLEIRSSDFEDVATVAVQKYGKPTKTSTEMLQNRMGAKFQNTVHHWQGKGGRYIRLTRYSGGSLEYGLMYFGSAEDTAMLKEASAPKSDDM